MVDNLSRELKKFCDLDELSAAAAENIVRLIVGSVSRKGSFSVALSGGNTPRTLHHLLATRYRNEIPWENVSVFFGDERYVPHTDEQSNYLMARETLLNLVPIPSGNIHPIPTDFVGPEKAAEAYEAELRSAFGNGENSFDLLLLGMGKEGHTASLFPGLPALDENRRWVLPVEVPAVPAKRISLTFPILNRSSAVYFLVAGGDKSGSLAKVLDSGGDVHIYPAKGVIPSSGRVVFWVDSAALGG